MTDGLRISELNETGYSDFGDLTVNAYRSLEGMPTLEKGRVYYEELRDVAGRAQSASNMIIGAFDSKTDNLLGGLTFVRRGYGRQWGIEDAAAIRMLAVSPNARGRGVGEALVHDSIARARAGGSPVVLLHTAAIMVAAQRLYERIGFERNPKRDMRFHGTELMAYELVLA